jgi:hypothetical protein
VSVRDNTFPRCGDKECLVLKTSPSPIAIRGRFFCFTSRVEEERGGCIAGQPDATGRRLRLCMARFFKSVSCQAVRCGYAKDRTVSGFYFLSTNFFHR